MTEKEMILRWARTWKEAGPALELIRVRDEDTALSLQLLAPAFEHAARTQPADDGSGMVEMQRVFAKLRR
jgi:hypothetical protein